jgi:hypothetical protein
MLVLGDYVADKFTRTAEGRQMKITVSELEVFVSGGGGRE